MTAQFITCNSATCGRSTVAPEDAVYDDRTSAYYCDIDCWRDWADANYDEIIAFYERLNVS